MIELSRRIATRKLCFCFETSVAHVANPRRMYTFLLLSPPETVEISLQQWNSYFECIDLSDAILASGKPLPEREFTDYSVERATGDSRK